MRAEPRTRGEDPVAQIIKREIPNIINQDNTALLVEMAKKLGEYLSRRMTTSQIRNIFGEVRRIEMQWEKDDTGASKRLLMLRPKLAYQAARFDEIRVLQEIIDHCIVEVGGDRARFQRLMDFFEAVLAYHRFYGGRD